MQIDKIVVFLYRDYADNFNNFIYVCNTTNILNSTQSGKAYNIN